MIIIVIITAKVVRERKKKRIAHPHKKSNQVEGPRGRPPPAAGLETGLKDPSSS